MPYEIKKLPSGWRILWVTHLTIGRQWRHIPKTEWPAIGFSTAMTLEEARAFARSINTSNRIVSQEARRQSISARLHTEATEECIYLPKALVQSFLEELEGKRNAPKLLKYWSISVRIIKEAKLEVSQWGRRPEKIYNVFKSHNYSLSHCEKIIHVMNLWCEYLSYKTSIMYKKLPYLKGEWRTDIEESHYSAGKPSKESAPITPADLSGAKSDLSIENYNFIFCTVWFGLRPIEIDKFHSKPPGKDAKGHRLSQSGTIKVLEVYQWKLRGVAYHKRWKMIPILFPEQHEALTILLSGKFKRPLTKTLKKWIKPDCNNYGGRKGFESLMRSKGRSFFEAVDWLGHLDINRTWKDYKQKHKVFIE